MKPRFFLSTKFVCQNFRIVFSTDSVPRYDISRPGVVPEIFFLSRHVLLSEEFSGCIRVRGSVERKTQHFTDSTAFLACVVQ
jgi:hypothetical protein